MWFERARDFVQIEPQGPTTRLSLSRGKVERPKHEATRYKTSTSGDSAERSARLLVSVMLEWVVLGRTNCRKFQGESWGRCSDYATRPAAAGCTGLTNTSPCADCADQSGRAEQHADGGRRKQATVGEGERSAGEPSGGDGWVLRATKTRD